MAAAAIMLLMRAAHTVFSVFFPRGIALRIRNGVAVMLLAACWLAAQSPKKSPAPKATSRLATAIDQTLAQGYDAILPAHVSNLLGISLDAHEVPVKQANEMGEPIRGFDVSVAEHNNVVLFVDSRAEKKATYYLTSRHGVLRKVLSVADGVGHDRSPTMEDKEAFEKEKQHWLDVLAPKLH